MIWKYNFKEIWKFVWPWLLIVFIWQLLFVFNLANLAFLASPTDIILSFTQYNFWEILGLDLFSTLSRLALAVLLSYLFSLIVIYISLWLPWFFNLISSLNNVWKYLPAPVIIPLAILAFGLTDFAKTGVVFFTVFVLYLSHCINVVNKNYAEYRILSNSWRLNANQKFWNIFLPQNNFLSFRILPQVVLWGMATAILTELILGGKTGLGLRLLLFQQLYKTNYLYAYLIVILIVSFILERVLISLFSTYKWDFKRIFSGIAIFVLTVFSLIFQVSNLATNIQNSDEVKIVSYKSIINLPILVYEKKFNRLGARVESVGTGLQAMDAMQAGKATIGGYSDMPNALQALQSNSVLKIASQITETPNNPALFLVANRNLDPEDLSGLNGSTIGYFPNNPVVQQGLDFVLFTKKVKTGTINYTSSNDPATLVQAMIAGKIDALVSFEPYISDVEEKLNTKRINPDKTLIGIITFKNLPLAGLVLNTEKLVGQDKTDFLEDMDKSLNFIKENTNKEGFAIGELKDILKNNDLNVNSRIPTWQNSNSVQSEDLSQLILILKTYSVEGFDNLDTTKLDQFYIK
jgi:NitT/TauT family transport system permease protein